jgi:DNA-binding NarL/FixJ family response regulator
VPRAALQIEDPDLLDRVATILAGEPGLSLADDENAADVVIADQPPSPSWRGGAPRIVLAEPLQLSDLLNGGAVSMLPRDCSGADLLLAIEATLRGYAIMPLGLPGLGDPDAGGSDPRGPSRAPPDDLLTARERDVLRLLAEGASNKEIARRLGISFHTAKFHVASVAAKLDATGRTDAVAQAVRLGLIML